MSLAKLLDGGNTWDPAVSPGRDALEDAWRSAAQQDRRIGSLTRLRLHLDRGKAGIDPFVLRDLISPERLHGRHRIGDLAPAPREVTAEDLGLLTQPASADAEQEPTARIAIERGDILRQRDRLVQRQETDSRSDLQRFGDRRRACERDHRRRQRAGEGRRLPRVRARIDALVLHRHQDVLADPQRSKAAIFGGTRDIGDIDRAGARGKEETDLHELGTQPGGFAIKPCSNVSTIASMRRSPSPSVSPDTMWSA